MTFYFHLQHLCFLVLTLEKHAHYFCIKKMFEEFLMQMLFLKVINLFLQLLPEVELFETCCCPVTHKSG